MEASSRKAQAQRGMLSGWCVGGRGERASATRRAGEALQCRNAGTVVMTMVVETSLRIPARTSTAASLPFRNFVWAMTLMPALGRDWSFGPSRRLPIGCRVFPASARCPFDRTVPRPRPAGPSTVLGPFRTVGRNAWCSGAANAIHRSADRHNAAVWSKGPSFSQGRVASHAGEVVGDMVSPGTAVLGPAGARVSPSAFCNTYCRIRPTVGELAW